MVEKEALYWRGLKPEKRKIKTIQCELCPHFCVIENGDVGKCGVRQNVNGRLLSLVYEKPVSVNLDPIEKKPLYHFLPGSVSLSIATVGCNLKCLYCQNADISQALPEDFSVRTISAQKIIEEAKKSQVKIISYTYTEPTIFYEYVLDIAKIARQEKIKNMTVTNGFINPEPLKELCKHIHGSNVDLKSMDEGFYKKICGGRLEPVLEAIKIMQKKKVWIELTNMIIPGANDSLYDIRKLISWVKNNLGGDVPVHFTAFYPAYKMMDKPQTPPEILKKARKIAIDVGLNYVYTGNIIDDEGSNTYCPKCRRLVIARRGFNVIENKLKKGKCACGEKIPGVWE